MDRESDNGYRHILKYTSIFGSVQGLNILVGLIRNKLVAMLLGPSGMGLASLFNSVVNFISQATNFGISFSAIKHVSELFDSGDEAAIRHYVKVVRVWSLLTALVGMFVCIAFGPLLSDFSFLWGNHTLHFILLSPAIGLLAITGGETAILKGARQLRSLAVIQVYSMLTALLISLPIYYVYGQAGVVPVIVLLALVSMLLTIWYSYRLYPLRLKVEKGILGEGISMVKLGIAFVIAGILGSGAEMLIRSYLSVRSGGLDIVGLYNAGFMLTVTYASMVFTAMETDYFPRLSSVGKAPSAMSQMVNRQIEVSLLIVSPMLSFFIILLPEFIPLLFTSEFLPVVGMAQISVFAIYIKAISLPISYITLARGDSVGYMVLEGIFDVIMVILVVLGYQYWGLFGTGVALSVSYFFDILLVGGYAYMRYQYRVSQSVLLYAAIQFSLGIAVYVVTWSDSPWVYWTFGLLFCVSSLLVSLHILHRKTSLWSSLTQKLKNKIHYDS